jgi:outer membrane protein OmpA-like peptidoglycan-associated protein
MHATTTECATRLRRLGRLVVLGAALALPGAARTEAPAAPLVHLTLTPASAKAINYRDLASHTVIGFRGTALLSGASGRARVVPRPGGMLRIKAKFAGMEPATRFGGEYLTYVLWAVTPAGRSANLGEVIVRRNGRADLEVDTNLQTFGLLVTAEPYFAVAQVSSLVVLENAVTRETRGQVEEVEARYELLPRGAYRFEGHPALPAATPQDRQAGPYFHQAFNALRIARAEGAERDAPVEFQKAADLLVRLQAEKKPWRKPGVLLARQATQQAEDARLVARKHQDDAALAQARQEAESARVESEQTRIQAELDKRAALDQADQARRQAEDRARQAEDQATRELGAEKLQLRRRLREQLNRLLVTRETDQGLVVSLSDLLFPTGRANLLPATREKLAKMAGVMLAYPGVRASVEGHADATGRPALNQRLSLRRAEEVRDYLVRQGLPPESATATGYGSDRPLASNATRSGRQQNRRVELVLTGGVIGF